MGRSFQEQKIGELPYAVQQPIDDLPDAVFEVTAKFPMKRMPIGVPQQERLRPDTRELVRPENAARFLFSASNTMEFWSPP